jgi:hypothetical protein
MFAWGAIALQLTENLHGKLLYNIKSVSIGIIKSSQHNS